MNFLQAALERAAHLRKQFGTRHCVNEVCVQCELMAMHREVERLELENARLRKLRDDSRCRHCGTGLVDGICGRCSS